MADELTFSQYQKEATKTSAFANPFDRTHQILADLGLHGISPEISANSRQLFRVVNAALNIAGEAGELVEHIKKTFNYGKKLDTVAVIKEAGDVLWALAELLKSLNIDLGDVAEVNLAKLRLRYQGNFDADKAINKVDTPKSHDHPNKEE